jgi:para-aminobenzoate synthetase
LSAGAFSLSYSTETSVLTFKQQGKRVKSLKIQESYWSWLDNFHSHIIQANTDALPAAALEQDAEVGQPILQVGLIGYLGYELKRESLPGYSYTPPISHASSSSQTDSQMIFANRVLWLDNYTGQWKILGLIRREDYDPIADFISSSVGVGSTEFEFDQDVSKIVEAFSRPPSPVQDYLVPLPSFVSDDDETSYSSSVEKAREAIREGETYELTMTTKFRAQAPGTDPYHLYLSLRARNPAPYSAFLNFPSENVAILSSSPERFISIDRNGVAEMKPIKGTLAVSPDKEEDERRKHTLATDVKELAENLMVSSRL